MKNLLLLIINSIIKSVNPNFNKVLLKEKYDKKFYLLLLIILYLIDFTINLFHRKKFKKDKIK